MVLLALMDPAGTAQRKTRRLKRRIYRNKVQLALFTEIAVCYQLLNSSLVQGPNFLWHCDGYDKLKPFGIGFAINGRIDG